MNKRLAQLRALSKDEWRVLLSSLVLLPLIAMSLYLKGFRRTQEYLRNYIPESKGPLQAAEQQHDHLVTAKSVARMVSIAANHGPYRANCLKRSLVAWWILQRKGIAVELNIGVTKNAGDFSAHAWVEYFGNVLVDLDNIEEEYSTFGPQ